ncbi:MAG: hypothetical protein ACUVRJ_08890 [Candidatus Villigracilaceae bacterium]
MKFLTSKLPPRNQIAAVYATAVVIIYAWSLIHFFWRFPSWLYFSTMGEIAVILAYLFTVNFIESGLAILAPVALSLILPRRWFLDRFVTRGMWLVILGLGYLAYFDWRTQVDAAFPYSLAKRTLLIALPIFALVFLLDKIKWLGRILEELGDRLTVFLYIFVPLSVLSFLTVLIRNLF